MGSSEFRNEDSNMQEGKESKTMDVIERTRTGTEVSTTGEWVLTLFLMAIPLVGFILTCVWAFGNTADLSKKNWAKAQLIWIIIGVIVVVIFYAVFGAAFMTGVMESSTTGAF